MFFVKNESRYSGEISLVATTVKERCFLGRKRRQKQWLIPNQLKRTKVQLGVHEVRITFTKPQIVTFLMVSNSFESNMG